MFSAAIINQSGGVQRELQVLGELVEVQYSEGNRRRLNFRQSSMAVTPASSKMFLGIHVDVSESEMLRSSESFLRGDIGLEVKPGNPGQIVIITCSGWTQTFIPTGVKRVGNSVQVWFDGEHDYIKLQSNQSGKVFEVFQWVEGCIREPPPPPRPAIEDVLEALGVYLQQGAREMRIRNHNNQPPRLTRSSSRGCGNNS